MSTKVRESYSWYVVSQELCFAKCGPWSSSTDSTWELRRSADYQVICLDLPSGSVLWQEPQLFHVQLKVWEALVPVVNNNRLYVCEFGKRIGLMFCVLCTIKWMFKSEEHCPKCVWSRSPSSGCPCNLQGVLRCFLILGPSHRTAETLNI